MLKYMSRKDKKGIFIKMICLKGNLCVIQRGANGENRTHTPKPERDFKSRASTYSATRASGAPQAIRTPDPLIKSQMLYQLS